VLIGALLIFVGEIGVPTGIPVELALLDRDRLVSYFFHSRAS